VRHVWPSRKSAETFVPLDKVKRRDGSDGECH
jgi:hypothetical protein